MLILLGLFFKLKGGWLGGKVVQNQHEHSLFMEIENNTVHNQNQAKMIRSIGVLILFLLRYLEQLSSTISFLEMYQVCIDHAMLLALQCLVLRRDSDPHETEISIPTPRWLNLRSTALRLSTRRPRPLSSPSWRSSSSHL